MDNAARLDGILEKAKQAADASKIRRIRMRPILGPSPSAATAIMALVSVCRQ
jgi:precorrin isomerase